MLLAALTLAVAPQPARTFDQERHLLSRRLETLRRILPDGRDPRRDVAELERTADEAGLIGLVATPRAESGDEPRHVSIDLEGEASYGDIDRFFGRLAVSHRLIDVAELTLLATAAELVRYEAVVRVPFHPTGTPLPAPPEGTDAVVRGVPPPLAQAFLRDEALALLKSDAIARLRRARRNPRLFLAETAAIVRDRPVLLSYANLGEEFLVRGLTVGEAPARALEARFERGFFHVDEFLMAVSGACHRFEVRGRAPVAGPDAELPLPAVEPFRLEPAACRIDRDPGGSRVVKAGSARGAGPLTLRLRDTDAADAFRVLHDLTGQGFLVDGDVRGRLDVELVRVTLEEAITELRGAGLRISPPGLIRRVSRAEVAPAAGASEPAPEPGAGEPRVSFLLKRAAVRELLGVMSELQPGLAALGPQASLGEVSVWVREQPLGLVRSAVLDAAGLVERIADGQRSLLRASGADEAQVPMLADAPPRVLELGPTDVAVSEFDLAGVAGSAGSWRAYAYTATGTLHSWSPGAPLADARVRAVAVSDVQLESGAGSLRLFVPPVR